jgi:hypothetical protein
MAVKPVFRGLLPIVMACVVMLFFPAGLSAAENWIPNGDFESDERLAWQGGILDHGTVHSGHGSLRVDVPAGKAEVSGRYLAPVKLDQSEARPIRAAFWVRFDARRRTGPFRGGLTFRVDMVDGSSLFWYSHLEVEPSEMGSWVYREARWVPRCPIAQIRPSVYLHGCEGAIWVDDLYLGPAAAVPAPPRQTVPMAVTGASGHFIDWPRFESVDFRPTAHVFHLGEGNKANIELTWNVNVLSTAQVYLTSNTGSQYWTLYSPTRHELAQIFTDERLDRQGRRRPCHPSWT